MSRLLLRPWLLSLILLMWPTLSTSFAQENSQEDGAATTSQVSTSANAQETDDETGNLSNNQPEHEAKDESVEEAITADPISQKRLEAAQLLIGNFLQQSVQSIDISYLSPFETEIITVIEHGYLPGSNGPAAYWLIELENTSEDYLKPMNVLNYLAIRQETAEDIRSFVEMRSELYWPPNAQWSSSVDLNTLRMAPGAIWQIHLSAPVTDPFSEYALVNRLIDESIHVGLPESSQEERLFHLMMADPTFSIEDYDIKLEALELEIKQLKEASQKQAMTDFDATAPKPIELESLDQAITDQLTLIEHGVEDVLDPVQTSAYWIFEVGDDKAMENDQQSEEINTSDSAVETDASVENDPSKQSAFRYIAKDLWLFKGIQENAGLSLYDIPLALTVVVPTPGGLYMPIDQPTYQAAASDNWHGYLKLSFPITSPLHDHYLEYQGERFDIIGDWGLSVFN